MTLTSHESASLATLTRRERQVFACVARGEGFKGIASELGIELKTAQAHLCNLRGKLGNPTRAQITALALKAGAVTFDELVIDPQGR